MKAWAIGFTLLALAGCSSTPNKPLQSYNPTASLALNVATNAGLVHPGGLRDMSKAEFEKYKDTAPSMVGEARQQEATSSGGGSLVTSAAGIALGVMNPIGGLGKAGSAALMGAPGRSKAAVDVDWVTVYGVEPLPMDVPSWRGLQSMKDSMEPVADDPNYAHLVAWVPAGDEKTIERNIHDAVVKSVIAASQKPFEFKTFETVSLLGIKNHGEGFVTPGCVVKSRTCSGGIVIANSTLPNEIDPPIFLGFKGKVIGPIEIVFALSEVLPPRGNADEVYAWWKRFSAALPEGYYYYTPRLKGVPLVLHKGEAHWFVAN
jgi:hypothetical protein